MSNWKLTLDTEEEAKKKEKLNRALNKLAPDRYLFEQLFGHKLSLKELAELNEVIKNYENLV